MNGGAWDWYQASVWHGGHEAVLHHLRQGLDLAEVVPAKAMHGYHCGAQVVRGDAVLARVWWGGNPGVHVQATGARAGEVVTVLRERWPDHSVTRADVCMDWRQVGLFDELAGGLLAYAKRAGIAINQQGDWARGQARTLYLGAPSSAVRLVLYEKGYEVGAGAPLDWVRLEVRVRPGRHARERVARWRPADAWGSCRWLCEALEGLGWSALARHSVGTVWRPADVARARFALVRQYGAILDSWIEEAGSLESWRAEFEVIAAEAASWVASRVVSRSEQTEGVGDD